MVWEGNSGRLSAEGPARLRQHGIKRHLDRTHHAGEGFFAVLHHVKMQRAGEGAAQEVQIAPP